MRLVSYKRKEGDYFFPELLIKFKVQLTEGPEYVFDCMLLSIPLKELWLR
jgi:hypothetical protein